MLATIAVGTVTAGKVVMYGCLLGIGFWVSKKVTGMIDEQLVIHDKKLMSRLAQQQKEICNAA